MQFIPENSLLADLYQAAVMTSPQAFQQTALQKLERAIGFDRAWWGIMSPGQAGFDLLSSCRYELPIEFEEHWHSIKNDDALAQNVHVTPRTTVHFNQKALHSTPGLAALNTGHDLRHALCTSVFLPGQTSFLFISLFRSGAHARPFTPDEIMLKQLLTPHLYSCWRTNLIAAIERTRMADHMHERASAFVDSRGTIVYADATFADFVTQAWPSWNGSTLPKPLADMMAGKEHASLPAGFYADRHQAGGLARLELGRVSALDKLTRREREIAQAFAQARSYKEIAADTGLTPATVRHYLRTIYAKLEINDKAELVHLVDKHGQKQEASDIGELVWLQGRPDIDGLGNGMR